MGLVCSPSTINHQPSTLLRIGRNMAVKKYLSLEEAAQVLGVRSDEVIRLREKGDLRGFADRGTWKFKADDVEETKRRRQPDSNPDVSFIDDEDSVLDDGGMLGGTSDSDVRLVMGDDLKTNLTGSSGDVPVFQPKTDRDSDIKLVGAPSPKKGSDSDVKLIKSGKPDSGMKLSESDSDVRLAAPSRGGKGDSGKKSRPSDSDSDVRLTAPLRGSLGDSDSDVRLSPPPGSDSDVKLVDPRHRGRGILPDEDDRVGMDLGDSVLLDDSGINVGKDSGIRLTGDSSLRLSGESGIQIRRPQDSGILLERPGDSGFRLVDDEDVAFKLAEDSGIKVGDNAPRSTSKLKQKPAPPLSDDDLQTTMPMLLADEDSGDRTDPEVPLLLEDDEDDLMPRSFGRDDETQAETNVILFDDEEDLDDAAATVVRKKSPGMSSKELDTAAFEMDSDDYSADDIMEAGDDSFADESLEEVFEAEADGLDDSFADEGMSAADFSTTRGVIAAAPEIEWGAGTVSLLAFSSLFMIVGGWMACDLLGTVFASGGPTYTGPFVEGIAGLFK